MNINGKSPLMVLGSPEIAPWRTLESTDVLKDRWIHVSRHKVQTPQGAVLDSYYLIHPSDWVLVIAHTHENQWILVEQYRHGVQSVSLEFCAGGMDANETAVEAGMRELLEETGFGGGEWAELGSLPVNGGHSAQRYHIVFAKGVQRLKNPDWDVSEDLRITLWDLNTLEALIRDADLADPKHQCAWFRFRMSGIAKDLQVLDF